MLDTIEEPMARDFQNTPYFNQSNNLRTFGGCPKFVIFSKSVKLFNFDNFETFRTFDIHQQF